MRQLVLLVCMAGVVWFGRWESFGGEVLSSVESPSGKLGFYPVSNEISFYKNYDDAGRNRGQTLQVVAINSFRVFAAFTFEFTADFNWRYSYIDPQNCSLGKNRSDYYLELSLVKRLTPALSLNVQRVLSTFEPEGINQFGLRLSL